MTAFLLNNEQKRLLLTIDPDRSLLRGCFEGEPFRLTAIGSGIRREQRFDQELVYAMVAWGYLSVSQRGMTTPYSYVGRPFCVLLTKDGEKARLELMSSGLHLSDVVQRAAA